MSGGNTGNGEAGKPAGGTERREGWAVPMDRVEAFTRGAALAVEPDAIEKELSALWRQAAERSRAEGSQFAVTRACLWNLVVHVSGEDAFQELKGLLDKVSEAVPTRLIVLVESQPGEVWSGSEPVRASVEANLRRSGERREVISEEITLEAPSSEMRRVLQLVRSLLLPDLPTALFFAGDLPGESPDASAGALPGALPGGSPDASAGALPGGSRALLRELVTEVDRVILDTGRMPGAAVVGACELVKPASLPGQTPTEVADLGWLRLSPWRALLASLFDRPEALPALDALDELHIQHTQPAATGAHLLAGWLISRLGWRAEAPGGVPLPGGLLDKAGRKVRVVFRQVDASESPAGIDQVRMQCGPQVFRVCATGPRCVELHSPIASAPAMQVVLGRSDSELLVTALGVGGRDPLMYEALRKSLLVLPGQKGGPS